METRYIENIELFAHFGLSMLPASNSLVNAAHLTIGCFSRDYLSTKIGVTGRKIRYFEHELIFRIGRNGIEWAWCQNNQFWFELIAKLVKLVEYFGNLNMSSFFELKEGGSNEPGVKIISF